MKRFLVREIAVLLVMALLIPRLSMAEVVEIKAEMTDDAIEIEELVDSVDMDEVELEKSVFDEDITLDILPDVVLGDDTDAFEPDSE